MNYFIIFQGVTGFAASFARAQVIDFSFRVQKPSFDRLLIRNPIGIMNYMSYNEPLHYNAWLAIGLFIIVTVSCLYLVTR